MNAILQAFLQVERLLDAKNQYTRPGLPDHLKLFEGHFDV